MTKDETPQIAVVAHQSKHFILVRAFGYEPEPLREDRFSYLISRWIAYKSYLKIMN